MRGFTMIEVMIVVAIVAILAAIALPNYRDYIVRGKIIEATSALSDLRSRFERYYLDNRSYASGCTTGGIKAAAQAGTKAFIITCTDADGAYVGTATGDPSQGMDATAIYKIDQANQKTTAGVPSGWSNQTCGWVIRRDGSCS